MRSKKEAKLYTFIFILIISAVAPAYANNVGIPDLKKQIEQNRQRIQGASGELTSTRAEKSEAQSELDEIDKELNQVTDEYNYMTEQLEIITDELEKTEASLANAIVERETQYEVFKERVRIMYMNGSVGYLEVLLSANDFSDFLNRLDYISLIAEYDKGVLDRLQQIEAEINEHLNNVERQKREIEILQAQLEKKQAELEIALNQKVLLIERLSRDEKMYQQQIADWQQANSDIEKLIKRKEEEERKRREAALAAAAKKNVSYSGGVVAWPVPASGRETSPYGNRTSPIHGRKEFHSGIDIGAPTGTAIVAAEAGVVIFSGTMSSYGKTVIVDHQNGMSTLYAHASKLEATVGQKVSRGQVIAKVGSTGNSTGPHLHFEVRIGGVHKNPKNYLK